MMRYLDVCAGISASTVAWKPLGWEAAAYSEIEAAPRAVLAHHYPNTPLHGDFTTIRGDEYGAIDLLVGGTPCQDFSDAGRREGLDGDRGNLSLEFCELADRSGARWLVWENVTGVLSNDGGRAFGAILGAMVRRGFGVAYRVLDAQYFGLPQRRKRVIVVGYRGDWRASAAVLFERGAMSGRPNPRKAAGKGAAVGFSDPATPGIAKPIGAHSSAKGRGTDLDNTTYIGVDLAQITSATNRTRLESNLPLSTLLATSRMVIATDSGVRYMTPIEHERVMGFPDNYTLVPYRKRMMAAGPRQHMLGNSMAPPKMRWIGERIQAVETLRSVRAAA